MRAIKNTDFFSAAIPWLGEDYRKSCLTLTIVCMLLYGNTLWNGYSLDDDFAVTDNQFVQNGIRGISGILTHPYVSLDGKAVDYRPVAAITFALEKAAFGSNPHISHFVNVILYCIYILVVFHVLRGVFRLSDIHWSLPFVITLFYAAHPVHTEVVSSIKNREELLSALFAFLAMLQAFRFMKGGFDDYAVAGSVFLWMMLSYLAKLSTVTIVPILFLVGVFYGMYRHRKMQCLIFIGLLLFLTVSYLIFAFTFLYERQIFDLENPLVTIEDKLVRLGVAFEAGTFYLRFLVFPYPHRFYYGYDTIPLHSIFQPSALLSMFLHLALLVAGGLLFWRKNITGLFVLCYLVSILMYINLVTNYTGIVSERALFIPSLWFIAALCTGIYTFLGIIKPEKMQSLKRWAIVACGCCLFLTYGALTIKRNFQWKDTLTLMAADIPHLTQSALANYFYAMVLKKQAETATGDARQRLLRLEKKHLKQTLQIAPYYRPAFYHLGMLYEYEEQQSDSAYYYFLHGYQIDAHFNPLKFQFARQLYIREQYADAEVLFQQLLSELPDDIFTLYFYARVLFALGKTEEAYRINDQLFTLAPQTYYAYVNAGNFNRALGDTQHAAENYEKALLLGFRDNNVVEYLIAFYQTSGDSVKLLQLATYHTDSRTVSSD